MKNAVTFWGGERCGALGERRPTFPNGGQGTDAPYLRPQARHYSKPARQARSTRARTQPHYGSSQAKSAQVGPSQPFLEKKDCLFFGRVAPAGDLRLSARRRESTQINPICLKSNQSQAESDQKMKQRLPTLWPLLAPSYGVSLCGKNLSPLCKGRRGQAKAGRRLSYEDPNPILAVCPSPCYFGGNG
jgi:hypothetical protein